MSVSTAQRLLDLLLGVLGVLASILVLFLVCYFYARVVFFIGDLCSKLKSLVLRRFSIRHLSEEICGRMFYVFDKFCDNIRNDPAFSTFRAINPNCLDTLFALFALTVICFANTFSKRLSIELFIDIKTYILLRHQQSRCDRLSQLFHEICSFNGLGEISTLDGFTGYLDIFLEEYLSPSSRQSIIVPLLRYAFIVFPDTSRISLHGRLDFS